MPQSMGWQRVRHDGVTELDWTVLQCTRLSCPPPTAGACSDSCPLSHRCHPNIASSVCRGPFMHQFVSIVATALLKAPQLNLQNWMNHKKTKTEGRLSITHQFFNYTKRLAPQHIIQGLVVHFLHKYVICGLKMDYILTKKKKNREHKYLKCSRSYQIRDYLMA